MPRKRIFEKEQVLGAIERWLVKEGQPPTVDELRAELGLGSTRTALGYLEWLEESGDIERWPGARGIRLLKRQNVGLETVAVPLIGEAPAGPMMVAEQNYAGWVRLPKKFLKPISGKFFLLRVRGNSMNKAVVLGEAIEDGDLVLIRQESSASAQDIVVALIDGAVTIKRLIGRPGHWMLKPESTDQNHQPIILDERFRVQGIVCMVIKNGAELLEE
ncbi:MAG: transcriptional repressor LexA [Patescibacteria group bacterium]